MSDRAQACLCAAVVLAMILFAVFASGAAAEQTAYFFE